MKTPTPHNFLIKDSKVRLLLEGNYVVNGCYNIIIDHEANTFYTENFRPEGQEPTIHQFDRIVELTVPGDHYNILLANAQEFIDQEFIDTVDVENNGREYDMFDTSNAAEEFKYIYKDESSWMVWNAGVELQSKEMYHSSSVPSINPQHIEYGGYRKSESVAIDALKLNKVTNRLHALVEQLDGFCEWVENSPENYTIVYDGKEYITEGNVYKNPGVVYMTLSCANEICSMLNYGLFKLEGNV